MELVTPSAEDLLKALERHDKAISSLPKTFRRALTNHEFAVLKKEGEIGGPLTSKDLLSVDASVPHYQVALERYTKNIENQKL